MQVRSIEFQENFRSVTVEASRQQNVVQREAEAAQHQAAVAGAEEQALNLTRSRPTTETEGRIVDSEAEGNTNEQGTTGRRQANTGDDSDDPEPRSGLPRGSVVDLTA